MTDRCPLTPCATCPWRKDSVGGAAIPGFDIEKARDLRATVGPGDDFRTIMACHGSEEGHEIPCVGYLIREGYSNLNVRVQAAVGNIPMTEILDRNADLDLHDTFDDMLDALEEAEAS